MIACPNCGHPLHGPRRQCPACGIEAGELEAVADGGRRDDGNQQRGSDGNQPPRGDGQNPQSGRPQQGGGRGGGHQPRGQQGQPPQGGQQPPNQGQQGQPPQGQGRGGQQAHQGTPPQGGPPRGAPPGGGDDDSGLTDRLTRRQMLIGGGGAVVLAAGGGYWYLSRGPSGAKGVVASYYSAVDSYDEDALLDVYHEDSPNGQYLDENGIESFLPFREEYYENVDISVQALFEMEHLTGAEDIPINSQNTNVDELKDILAVVKRDASGWEQAEENAEDDDDLISKRTRRYDVVRSEGGSWKLWA